MSSNPMNAKKPRAAPRAISVQPTSVLARNRCAAGASADSPMNRAPATMTIRSPVSSIIVATMFALDDSRMPRKLIAASTRRMPTVVARGESDGASALMYPPKATETVASERMPEHNTTQPTTKDSPRASKRLLGKVRFARALREAASKLCVGQGGERRDGEGDEEGRPARGARHARHLAHQGVDPGPEDVADPVEHERTKAQRSSQFGAVWVSHAIRLPSRFGRGRLGCRALVAPRRYAANQNHP